MTDVVQQVTKLRQQVSEENSIGELREIAKDYKVKGRARMSKKQLVDAVLPFLMRGPAENRRQRQLEDERPDALREIAKRLQAKYPNAKVFYKDATRLLNFTTIGGKPANNVAGKIVRKTYNSEADFEARLATDRREFLRAVQDDAVAILTGPARSAQQIKEENRRKAEEFAKGKSMAALKKAFETFKAARETGKARKATLRESGTRKAAEAFKRLGAARKARKMAEEKAKKPKEIPRDVVPTIREFSNETDNLVGANTNVILSDKDEVIEVKAIDIINPYVVEIPFGEALAKIARNNEAVRNAFYDTMKGFKLVMDSRIKEVKDVANLLKEMKIPVFVTPYIYNDTRQQYIRIPKTVYGSEKAISELFMDVWSEAQTILIKIDPNYEFEEDEKEPTKKEEERLNKIYDVFVTTSSRSPGLFIRDMGDGWFYSSEFSRDLRNSKYEDKDEHIAGDIEGSSLIPTSELNRRMMSNEFMRKNPNKAKTTMSRNVKIFDDEKSSLMMNLNNIQDVKKLIKQQMGSSEVRQAVRKAEEEAKKKAEAEAKKKAEAESKKKADDALNKKFGINLRAMIEAAKRGDDDADEELD